MPQIKVAINMGVIFVWYQICKQTYDVGKQIINFYLTYSNKLAEKFNWDKE
jgi:hypothetical protein